VPSRFESEQIVHTGVVLGDSTSAMFPQRSQLFT
jgi:hypothetical protein